MCLTPADPIQRSVASSISTGSKSLIGHFDLSASYFNTSFDTKTSAFNFHYFKSAQLVSNGDISMSKYIFVQNKSKICFLLLL